VPIKCKAKFTIELHAITYRHIPPQIAWSHINVNQLRTVKTIRVLAYKFIALT